MKCVTMDSVKPKVLAPGMYAIDVGPIPPRCRNNREVHLDYLKHLMESVETLREIVEEARVERPLYRSLAFVRLYTKQSQEVLGYAIGTCPKEFNKQDKKHATTPLNRKKKVTLSISSIRAIINLNSRSICKTCNKCFISANHDMCVVNYLTSVNASPSVKNVVCKVKKVWKPKQVKQVWKATGKQLTNVGYKWKPTGRIFTLGEQFPLTRLTKSNILPIQQTENVIHIVLWYLDSGCSKHMTGDRLRLRNFMKKFIGTVRFRNNHFGAIMGYGYYVIGDSVISMVYYVEGLGHNLFSVRQFYDFDLEVAFRKHSCYVRDTDGVDLIKGSHGSNLYTISVEDTMKSPQSACCPKPQDTNHDLLASSFKPLVSLYHHCPCKRKKG
ncbi:hypothetical protein Tco_0682377 [Tanacetum coccineum]|uniref:Retrovirus-related Pol polyprotein from transposon TNT 1-94-like beta-barrel domain-containing protein n=1 Tax=Tanacetum coccineum TaxID=301880 RepID=A0ABQ4XSM1_9ASTR